MQLLITGKGGASLIGRKYIRGGRLDSDEFTHSQCVLGQQQGIREAPLGLRSRRFGEPFLGAAAVVAHLLEPGEGVPIGPQHAALTARVGEGSKRGVTIRVPRSLLSPVHSGHPNPPTACCLECRVGARRNK